MEYLIIANEFSGTDRGRKVLKEVEKYMTEKSLPFTIWKTGYIGHAAELSQKAVSEGYKFIIAVGGDGTLNEIINGLDLSSSSDITLALIPSGSGNDFVRNTKLQGKTNNVLDYIFENKPSLVDCCIVNGTKFINMCGIGLDVELLLRQERIKKIFKGRISYYIALLQSLFFIKFRKMKYIIDDNNPVECQALLLAVGNGSTYGGGLPVAPLAQIQDGLLDVCIVRKLSRFKVPSLLLKFLNGKHIDVKEHVSYYKCKKLYVECDSPFPINLDGELMHHSPCNFTIIPKCIKIYI